LYQLRDAGETGSTLLRGSHAAKYMFASSLVGWQNASASIPAEALASADILGDRITFSLRQLSAEGPTMAHRLAIIESDWGILTESLVLFWLSCRTRGNRAISLEHRRQLMATAREVFGSRSDKASGDTASATTMANTTASTEDALLNQLTRTTTDLGPSQKQDFLQASVELCRDLGKSTLNDLIPLLSVVKGSLTSENLASALESMSSARDEGAMSKESEQYERVIDLQRRLLLVAMESLISLLRKCGIMTREAVRYLFEPVQEIFLKESNDKLIKLITAPQEKDKEFILRSLGLLRGFIVSMMSKVASTEEEVCIQFSELLPDPSVPQELNESHLNVAPVLSFFNILGLKWIARAKMMELNPLSRHPKYPSEQILQRLAYSERDREVILAKGTSILIGSALGTEQQIAWAVFASARYSCECRSELAYLTVDPLIDIIENLIHHYFNIVKYQHRTGSTLRDGGANTNTRMTRTGTDVIKGPRWSRQLTTPDPFYGKTSIMGLILSCLHHKMDVEKWQRTMSAQKRI